jgi:hypothetical protein
VWFVLDAVAGMNLGGFYGVYRRDGVGRRAYDPAMMGCVVAVRVFARDTVSAGDRAGVCEEDVAFRVIAMVEAPDQGELSAAEVVRSAAADERQRRRDAALNPEELHSALDASPFEQGERDRDLVPRALSDRP